MVSNALVGLMLLGVASQPGATTPPYWPCEQDDGAPFGHLVDSDVDQLVAVARSAGVDLVPTVEKVHSGDKAALASIFQLSKEIQKRDVAMRVYGNMVYSIFLNLGENGPPIFVPTLLAQETEVRQRVRDFLWYPIFCTPEAQRGEAGRAARAYFPELWPADWEFGKNDSLFITTPSGPIEQSVYPVTPLANEASGAPARPAAYPVR